MDARLILAGQAPDIVGALNNGAIAGQNALAGRQQAQLAQFLQANGSNVLAGDQNALGQMATFGPEGLNTALGVQSTQLDMRATQNRMDVLNDENKRRIAEAAAQMSEQEAAKVAADAAGDLQALALATTAQEWDHIAQARAPEAVGMFGNRMSILAQNNDALTAFAEGRKAAEKAAADAMKPQSSEGKLQADIAAGLVPAGTTIAPQSVVNVGAGSSEYNKTREKQFGETMGEIAKSANSARSALTSLSAMESSMADPNFYSGTGAELALAIKRVGASLGWADADSVASMEQFNSRASAAALSVMGGSLGAGFSNADRDFVMTQVPNLGNTPEGNKAVISALKKVEQRKIDIAAKAREYERKNGQIDANFEEELAKWSDSNPLFPAAKTAAPGTVTVGGYTIEQVE